MIDSGTTVTFEIADRGRASDDAERSDEEERRA
jgi:hypothetical protein